jgi:class 3 adenylate cyclase
MTLSFVVGAVLLLLRRPGSSLIRSIFLTMIAISFAWIPFQFDRAPILPLSLTYTWAGLSFVANTMSGPLALRSALLFPEGTRGVLPLPWWPWLFGASGPLACSWVIGGGGLPQVIVAKGDLFYNILFLFTYLLVLTHRFVLSDSVGRRQIKWLLYGNYIGCVPLVLAQILVFLNPSLILLLQIAPIFVALIPVCGIIAVIRYNLFDIDRLISVTAAYTIGSVVLMAAALILIPRFSQVAIGLVGLNPAGGQLLVSLLLAAVVVPSSRYLRPLVERFFFAERYALERGVETLLRSLSACTSPQEVLALTGERLDFYLRPECCVIYGRSSDTYVPLFVRGRTVAPVLNAGVPLVSALLAEARSVEMERWLRRPDVALSAADRAVLDSLGAAILVPMHRANMMAAFLCLGQKRSGDIYTATDLTLLSAVAEKVSAELQRFDEAEIALEVRAISDALRRYVPEPIAAQIVSGQNLEARETDVSILFVDIRGYTAYAETKPAAEVFSAVNRYTETVSRIVRAHGGTVAEFNGDGMMAVFGAPALLEQKERAAVTASREILLSVRSLDLGVHHEQPLEVGVGIATGKAFVGSIQSIDRLIWRAIGDISNLAARLQGLTRELNAAIVIDSATRMKAGSVADDFERHDGMPIRGRHQSEDIYTLSLSSRMFPTSTYRAG